MSKRTAGEVEGGSEGQSRTRRRVEDMESGSVSGRTSDEELIQDLPVSRDGQGSNNNSNGHNDNRQTVDPDDVLARSIEADLLDQNDAVSSVQISDDDNDEIEVVGDYKTFASSPEVYEIDDDDDDDDDIVELAPERAPSNLNQRKRLADFQCSICLDSPDKVMVTPCGMLYTLNSPMQDSNDYRAFVL
ncbi:hypothetical protein TRICI_004352 [Trichomonascus ciferrii]|uniref:Uncharacterized protein n=1 Tax=Trichomonascus ciferrii TaxID=44093 RepID=A0A642V1A8_9ASCO|nr:hypothetical protein TRICI_004352 [Trichomonascus ciferrii]